MKVRLINSPKLIGSADKFNISTTGEVIAMFGDIIDSYFISELDVYVNGVWIPLSHAFKNHDVITDNENTEFFEPKDEEERKRGYRLWIIR